MFTGTMLTGLPVSATNVSYLFPLLPKIFPFMLGDDLCFLIREIFRIRLIISVKEFGAGIGAMGSGVESFDGWVSAGGDGCGVVLLSSLVVGCDGAVEGDGKLGLNNLLRCLGFNQGSGSLMSTGSDGRYVGRSTWSVGDSSLVSGGV